MDFINWIAILILSFMQAALVVWSHQLKHNTISYYPIKVFHGHKFATNFQKTYQEK